MPNYHMPGMPASDEEAESQGSGSSPPPRRWTAKGGGSQPQPPRFSPSLAATLASLALTAIVVYAVYLWFFVRVVVDPSEVLVLLKKNGVQSLPGNEFVIPAPPDKTNTAAYAAWEKKYDDRNGIIETPFKPGTYFSFSPFDYEREVQRVVKVPDAKVGLVVKKFGTKLDPGQVLADPERNQCGPLPIVLQPGTYPQYSNTFAYEVKLVDPVIVEPGNRGVVTIMAGKPAKNPNDYLVATGEQGVQPAPENEGMLFTNLFQKRIMPISVRSQRLEMAGTDAIRFPSADSFDIRMEGFVEWKLDEKMLPLIYVQYGEGGGLIEQMEARVILPYSRTFSRLVGSQYTARDFISGDTKLKFQQEFETRLLEACQKQGIVILQALVRDIVPPDDIKNPINEREIAKQQILTYEQQMQVAKSSADLARQQEMATQNQKIGDANKQVVTVVTRAQQDANVAITQAQQGLAVAKLRLEAAQKEADAKVAMGQAQGAVILLNKQAEAEPLRQQVAAFGGGDAYAQYFFYQKVAPAIKSILTNTDGVFADMFKQMMEGGRGGAGSLAPTAGNAEGSKVSKAQEQLP